MQADWIEIRELNVRSRIGVPAAERSAEQQLSITIRYRLASRFSELEDQIDRTIDYGEVAQECARFAERAETRLLETFVSRLADALLERFHFRELQVEARKFVLADTAYVSASTTRERP